MVWNVSNPASHSHWEWNWWKHRKTRAPVFVSWIKPIREEKTPRERKHTPLRKQIATPFLVLWIQDHGPQNCSKTSLTKNTSHLQVGCKDSQTSGRSEQLFSSMVQPTKTVKTIMLLLLLHFIKNRSTNVWGKIDTITSWITQNPSISSFATTSEWSQHRLLGQSVLWTAAPLLTPMVMWLLHDSNINIGLLLRITSKIAIYKLFSSFHLHLYFSLAFLYTHTHIYIYIYIYIYMVVPPQGPPFEGAMYHLPSVVLNTFKDMLRKHCKFRRFMHILLVVFWIFCSLIR